MQRGERADERRLQRHLQVPTRIRVRHLVQEREPLAEVFNGFGVRRAARRLDAGIEPRARRGGEIPRPGEVVRQDAGKHGADAFAAAEGIGEAGVHRAALARKHGVVGHALEQRVAELVHGFRPVMPPPQDFRVDEPVERGEDVGARHAQEGGERVRREGAARAGGGLDDASRLAEPVEAFRQHLGEAERQRDVAGRRRPPGVAVLPGALVDEREGELLGEERNAVRGFRGAEEHLVRQGARARHGARELEAVGERQGHEADRGRRRGQAGLRKRRARGQHGQDRPVREALGQVGEQLRRGAVEPVGVLHPEQQRLVAHGALQERSQQGELLLLDEGRGRFGALVRRRSADAEQPGRDLHLLRRRLAAECGKEAQDLRARARRAVLGGQAGARPEQAGGGVERRVGEDLQAARLHGARFLGLDLGAKLRHQPRLADPRLAEHVDEPEGALARRLVPVLHQFAQWPVAAHEARGAPAGTVPAAVRDRPGAQDAVHEHDAGKAANLLRAERLGVEEAFHQFQGFAAHQHRPGRARRLQARGEVDGLTDRAVAAGGGIGRVR